MTLGPIWPVGVPDAVGALVTCWPQNWLTLVPIRLPMNLPGQRRVRVQVQTALEIWLRLDTLHILWICC